MRAANDRFYTRQAASMRHFENLKQTALGCLFAAVAIVVLASWVAA